MCGTWHSAIREEGLMLQLPKHIKLPYTLQVQPDIDLILPCVPCLSDLYQAGAMQLIDSASYGYLKSWTRIQNAVRF